METKSSSHLCLPSSHPQLPFPGSYCVLPERIHKGALILTFYRHRFLFTPLRPIRTASRKKLYTPGCDTNDLGQPNQGLIWTPSPNPPRAGRVTSAATRREVRFSHFLITNSRHACSDLTAVPRLVTTTTPPVWMTR